MEWIKFMGVGLVGMMSAVLLRQYKPEYAPLISLAAGGIIVVGLISRLQPVFSQLDGALQKAGIASEHILILIKSLGICYVTQLAADSCRDAGESAIASKMELVGKIAVLAMSLPYFTGMLDTVSRLIGI